MLGVAIGKKSIAIENQIVQKNNISLKLKNHLEFLRKFIKNLIFYFCLLKTIVLLASLSI